MHYPEGGIELTEDEDIDRVMAARQALDSSTEETG